MSDTTAAPVITSIDRPVELLPDEPIVESEEQANLALRELAFMQAHQASATGQCDERIRVLREATEKELAGYGDRRTALTAALLQYASDKLPELQTGNGPRSKELRQGVIGWQKSRDCVAYCKGKTHAKAVELLDEATAKIKSNEGGLLTRLTSLAGAIRLFSRDKRERTLALFVDLKATINLTRARKAVEEKQLSAAELKAWGIEYRKGGDQFYAEPTTYEVKR